VVPFFNPPDNSLWLELFWVSRTAGFYDIIGSADGSSAQFIPREDE